MINKLYRKSGIQFFRGVMTAENCLSWFSVGPRRILYDHFPGAFSNEPLMDRRFFIRVGDSENKSFRKFVTTEINLSFKNRAKLFRRIEIGFANQICLSWRKILTRAYVFDFACQPRTGRNWNYAIEVGHEIAERIFSQILKYSGSSTTI